MKDSLAMTIQQTAEYFGKSWRMLAGSERSFALAHHVLDWAAGLDHFTLTLSEVGQVHSVTVHIDRHDLLEMAQAMFGADETAPTEELVTDVGNELCNLFASGCRSLLDSRHIEMGLPKKIGPEEFEQILANGCVLFEFAATNQNGSPAVQLIRAKEFAS